MPSQVWCSILGLKGGVSQLSWKQVGSSPIFQLRGPKQGDKTIAGYWISSLVDLKALGDAPLDKFIPPASWYTVYSCESFQKYAPDIVKEVWSQSRGRPSMVVLVPADLAEVPPSFFLDNLHKKESIRRKSICYVDTKTGLNKCKQYCFCSYCGVLSMNEEAGFSHMRKHLRVEFLCGGCLKFKETIPKNMSFHMEICEPCIEVRKKKEVAEVPISTKKGGKKGGKKAKKKRKGV